MIKKHVIFLIIAVVVFTGNQVSALSPNSEIPKQEQQFHQPTNQQSEKPIDRAFMLLGVGMITVFTVLALVVLIGNVLIAFVNRFIPEPVKTARQVRKNVLQAQETITKKQIAAMVAAVDIVTGGKGKIVSVTKDSAKNK